ncbi:gag-Pol polyprotein [Nephila pilipes]|uniref:Gag-Pol polyprotein n=1 Tax=Nephila pilipes TaxID=299642 RepID=A0A8X6P8V6_NEPPI|nr:gag-Pol polyprotein [Nephila pilipes]
MEELMQRITRKMDMMKNLLERLAELMTELKTKMKAGQEEMKTEKKGRQEKMKTKMKAGQEELQKDIIRIKEEFSNIVQEKMNAIENKEQMSNGHEEPKGAFMPSLAPIKLLTFDGKTSWQVYKTQFTMVLEANGLNPRTKAFLLAASLRGDAANILKTLPEEQRHDFQALLAISDYPVETRQNLALQPFIDSVRDPETQKALRLADVKDIGSIVVYAQKIKAAQQAASKDRHSFRAVSVSDSDSDFIRQIEDLRWKIRSLEESKGGRNTKIQCWTCGAA